MEIQILLENYNKVQKDRQWINELKFYIEHNASNNDFLVALLSLFKSLSMEALIETLLYCHSKVQPNFSIDYNQIYNLQYCQALTQYFNANLKLQKNIQDLENQKRICVQTLVNHDIIENIIPLIQKMENMDLLELYVDLFNKVYMQTRQLIV